MDANDDGPIVMADPPEGEGPTVDLDHDFDAEGASLEELQSRYGPFEKWPEAAQLAMAEAVVAKALGAVSRD